MIPKSKKSVQWKRKSGSRLKRLFRHNDNNIHTHNIHTHNDNNAPHTAPLFPLPAELQIMIINNLPLSDVITLTRTCKSWRELIHRNYNVEFIILPLTLENRNKLDGRSILSIVSCFDIRSLRENEYIDIINSMNLKNLKKLKCIGQQYNNSSKTLSDRYILSLSHYLNQAHTLQSLDILVDNTKKTGDIMSIIAEKLVCLKELTLRSSGHMNDKEFNYPNRNCEYFYRSKNCHPNLTLNYMLGKVLQNTTITTLRLKGFWRTASWANYTDDPNDRYLVEIYSKHLEILEIQHCDFCVIKVIKCENLVQLDCECIQYGTPFIFDIARNGPNELAYFLAKFCPKLERFCEINIKELKEQGSRDWLEELTCPCEDCDYKKFRKLGFNNYRTRSRIQL